MIRARAAAFFDDEDNEGAPEPTWIMGIPYTGMYILRTYIFYKMCKVCRRTLFAGIFVFSTGRYISYVVTIFDSTNSSYRCTYKY